MLSFLNGVGKASGPSSTPPPPTISQNYSFTNALPSAFTYTGNNGVGTYRDSNGVLQLSISDQPRFDHDTNGNTLGLRTEETRTNKITGKNYNPVSGDETAAFSVVSGTGTISVVNKASALAAAGLNGICSNGNVYQISATSTFRFRINGTVDNTNAHSFGTYIAYGDTFYHGTLKIWGSSQQILLQDDTADHESFKWVGIDNDVPSASSRLLEFNIQDGRTIYLILFDLQEGAFMTSVIANSGSGSKTRTRDSLVLNNYDQQAYYNANEGAIIMQAQALVDSNHSDSYPFLVADGTGLTNVIGASQTVDRSKIAARVYGASISQLSGDIHGFKAGQRWPYAASWKNGGTASVLTGPASYKQASLSNAISGLDRVYVAGRASGQDFNGHVKSLKFYKTQRTIEQIGRDMILAGDRVLIAGGQSNMHGYFGDQTESRNDGEKALIDTYDLYRTASTNFIANGATSGSKLIENGGSNWWYDPVTQTFGPAWNHWNITAQSCENATIEAILWDQGESDVGETKADYKTALLAVFNQMRTVVGTLPVIIIPIGARSDTDQNGYQTIREAQWELASETSFIHLAPEKFDAPLEPSGTHLTNDGYAANAPRVLRKTMAILGETVSGSVDGPTITNAIRNGTTLTITVSHDGGTDFTPSTGIEGFVFLDGSSNIAITSAVRTNATTITLTLASTPSGVETLYYGYKALFGVNKTNLIKDNSAQSLPLKSAKIVL